MASQGLQELASLLPGGTYITFTVLAQLTTSGANMTQRLLEPACDCSSSHDTCTARYVCGAGFWEMTVALLVTTAVIVLVLAWYGEDLKGKKAQVVTASKEKKRGATPQEQQLQEQASWQQQAGVASAVPADAQTGVAAADVDAAAGSAKDTGDRLHSIHSTREQASGLQPFVTHQQQQQQQQSLLLPSKLPSMARQPQQQQRTLPLRPHQSTPASFAAPYTHHTQQEQLQTLATMLTMASHDGEGRLAGAATAGGRAAAAAAAPTANVSAAAAADAVAAVATVLPDGSQQLAKRAAANAEFVAKLDAMTAPQLRRKYAELVIHQVIRAVGGACIFLILALFTPPVSTCLLHPCSTPDVVVRVVPLLVSFAVSAFVTVKDKFVHRLVYAVDWLLHRKDQDREPGQWNVLTDSVEQGRKPVTGVGHV